MRAKEAKIKRGGHIPLYRVYESTASKLVRVVVGFSTRATLSFFLITYIYTKYKCILVNYLVGSYHKKEHLEHFNNLPNIFPFPP